MLNKVILKGNIGRAPKTWLTQNGRKLATFFLATSASWKDDKGEWQTCTDWHRITVFREATVGWMKDVLKKGDPVYVEGKLTYQNWTDKYGQSRLTPHVVISGREGRLELLRSFTHGGVSTGGEEQDESSKPSKSPEQSVEEDSQAMFSSSLPGEDFLVLQPCRAINPAVSH